MPAKKRALNTVKRKLQTPSTQGVGPRFIAPTQLSALAAAGTIPTVCRVHRQVAGGGMAEPGYKRHAWAIEITIDGTPYMLHSARSSRREWQDLHRLETQMRVWGFRQWQIRNDLEPIHTEARPPPKSKPKTQSKAKRKAIANLKPKTKVKSKAEAKTKTRAR